MSDKPIIKRARTPRARTPPREIGPYRRRTPSPFKQQYSPLKLEDESSEYSRRLSEYKHAVEDYEKYIENVKGLLNENKDIKIIDELKEDVINAFVDTQDQRDKQFENLI